MSVTPTETTRSPRPPRPQAVLEVVGKQRLSPRLLRLTLGGDGYQVLRRNEHTDAYVKLLLPAPGSGLTPPFDMDRLREESPDLLPSRRTYTCLLYTSDAADDIALV